MKEIASLGLARGKGEEIGRARLLPSLFEPKPCRGSARAATTCISRNVRADQQSRLLSQVVQADGLGRSTSACFQKRDDVEQLLDGIHLSIPRRHGRAALDVQFLNLVFG